MLAMLPASRIGRIGRTGLSIAQYTDFKSSTTYTFLTHDPVLPDCNKRAELSGSGRCTRLEDSNIQT